MKRADHLRMLKTVLAMMLVCVMILSVVACTKPAPDPEETTDAISTTDASETTDPVTESDTEADDTTPPEESDTESVTETESESETETRPEINLLTDPAEIVAAIDGIPVGSLEYEEEIDLLHASWAALPEDKRAEVTNYDVLCTRLQELADAYIVKEYSDDRIPHGKLILGVYYAHYNAAQMSDAHMQDLVDAHVDLAWAPSSTSKEFLDMFSKYGMGVFARGGNGGMPVWRAAWMGEGYGDIPTYTPDAAIELIPGTLANDHPAIWGLDVTDEPNSNNFWWFQQTVPTLQEAYNAQVFSNMHPSYGGPGPLGTYSYLKYVRNYANRVNSELFSYDFYVYAHYLNPENQNKNLTWASFLSDLSIQSEACADTGNDLVVIMQLNQGPWQDQSVTLEQLKYQAYTSMAFGNKYVVWACYAKNWSGGWHDAALDDDGNKTDQYYRMKDCHADLVQISPIYMRYTVKEQTMLNADPSSSAIPSFGVNHPLSELGQKTIKDLQVAENKDVLVGFYEKNIGEGEAFMFVNSSDILFSEPVTTTVSFRTVSGASIVTAYVKGVPTILDPVDGVYTIEVKDADAVFVTVTEPESINAKPAPAAPIGQLTIAGVDIDEFVVVIPNESTEREAQAAEVLVDLIKKATGKTLTVVADGTVDHAHYIYLGSGTTEALKADGYLIKTAQGNLYITGNDADGAGTLFGVYGFAEDYLGYRFYMADQITVTPADKVEIPDGLNEVVNPAFAYREATYYAGVVQPYPLYQKYNGDLMYGDKGYAAEWWAGESLYRLAELAITDTVCLSDETVYATVLENARFLMACDPDSDILGCSVGQGTNWSDCSCEACLAVTKAEGSPMALMLNFINRLAADLAVDYPNLKVETLAVNQLSVVPKNVRPADNVIVRILIPKNACHFHALNDTSCDRNADLCATLEAWTAICDNVMVLNNEVDRESEIVTGANLLTQYDTIKYLKDLGVMGYTNTGHDARSGELGELRNYLMSRLLWDADMTREDYLAEMDAFLKVYYGEGWTYIRQYIDKMCDVKGVSHSDYQNTISMLYRIKGRDTTFMKECIALLDAAVAAADTDVQKNHAERCKLHIYHDCIEVIRDKELNSVLQALADKYGIRT